MGHSAGSKKDAELVLEAFKNKSSLSNKGCSYDNAIAEAVYKIIKTEFAFNRVFRSLEELKRELNNMTPVEYRLAKMTE